MNINGKTAYGYFRDYVESNQTEDLVTKVYDNLIEEDFSVADFITKCIIRNIFKDLLTKLNEAEADNTTLLLAYSGSKYISIDEHQDSYPRFMLVSKDKVRGFSRQTAFEKICYYGVGEAPPDYIAILDLSPLDAVKIACQVILPPSNPWNWENLQIFLSEIVAEYPYSEESFAITLLARFVAYQHKEIAQDSEAHVHSCFQPSRVDCNTEFGLSEEKVNWLKFDYIWNKFSQYNVFLRASQKLLN